MFSGFTSPPDAAALTSVPPDSSVVRGDKARVAADVPELMSSATETALARPGPASVPAAGPRTAAAVRSVQWCPTAVPRRPRDRQPSRGPPGSRSAARRRLRSGRGRPSRPGPRRSSSPWRRRSGGPGPGPASADRSVPVAVTIWSATEPGKKSPGSEHRGQRFGFLGGGGDRHFRLGRPAELPLAEQHKHPGNDDREHQSGDPAGFEGSFQHPLTVLRPRVEQRNGPPRRMLPRGTDGAV